MRGRVVTYLIAAAGFFWTLAAPHYMSEAPSIIARIALTGAGLALCMIVLWAVLTKHKPRTRLMEYAIVGVSGGALSVLLWWALGLIPAETAIAPPVLRAEAQEEGTNYFIVVTNSETASETKAVVWADLKIISRHRFDVGSEQSVYRGFWEGSRSTTTELRPGQRDRLVIGGAEKIWESADSASTTRSDRQLYFTFYDPTSGGPDTIGQYWPGGSTPVEMKPHLTLGVTLRADPKLAREMSGVYHLTVDGLMETQPIASRSEQERRLSGSSIRY
jgi:hypothetical protein